MIQMYKLFLKHPPYKSKTCNKYTILYSAASTTTSLPIKVQVQINYKQELNELNAL